MARKLDADLLTPDETRRLLESCSPRCPTGIRNRALLALGWRAGLRLGECLSLRTSDLDQDRGTVTVQRGKGGKRRVVGLDPGAFAIVARWIDRRRELGVDSRLPLLCTLRGGRLSQSYVRALLGRLRERAGIEKRVHFHGLRHACAAEMAGEGIPVHVVQRQLGHASLVTTQTYLSRVCPTEVVDRVRERRWE